MNVWWMYDDVWDVTVWDRQLRDQSMYEKK